jgi:hypothetical protein
MAGEESVLGQPAARVLRLTIVKIYCYFAPLDRPRSPVRNQADYRVLARPLCRSVARTADADGDPGRKSFGRARSKRPISFRSPSQNGHMERLIGTVRRFLLDHERRAFRLPYAYRVFCLRRIKRDVEEPNDPTLDVLLRTSTLGKQLRLSLCCHSPSRSWTSHLPPSDVAPDLVGVGHVPYQRVSRREQIAAGKEPVDENVEPQPRSLRVR